MPIEPSTARDRANGEGRARSGWWRAVAVVLVYTGIVLCLIPAANMLAASRNGYYICDSRPYPDGALKNDIPELVARNELTLFPPTLVCIYDTKDGGTVNVRHDQGTGFAIAGLATLGLGAFLIARPPGSSRRVRPSG